MLVSTTLERSFKAMTLSPRPLGRLASRRRWWFPASPAPLQAGAHVAAGGVVEQAVVAHHRAQGAAGEDGATRAGRQAPAGGAGRGRGRSAMVVRDPVASPRAARDRGPRADPSDRYVRTPRHAPGRAVRGLDPAQVRSGIG